MPGPTTRGWPQAPASQSPTVLVLSVPSVVGRYAGYRGSIGLVSKSGTLTYQMMFELRDLGFSTAIGTVVIR